MSTDEKKYILATTEEDYLRTLAHERHMYAWCLMRYGNLSESEAADRAAFFYKYEQDDEGKNRWVVFHDLAWHWAMLRDVVGPFYWNTRPDLASPSPEYFDELSRFVSDASNQVI